MQSTTEGISLAVIGLISIAISMAVDTDVPIDLPNTPRQVIKITRRVWFLVWQVFNIAVLSRVRGSLGGDYRNANRAKVR